MIQNLFGLQKGARISRVASVAAPTVAPTSHPVSLVMPNDCFVRFGQHSKDITAQWVDKTKMGTASFQLGDYEKAYRYFSTAKELSDPDNPEQVVKTLFRLGRTCTMLKRYEEAERYLKKAKASYPENPGSTMIRPYELTDAMGELNIHWAQRADDTERFLTAGEYLKEAYQEYVKEFPDPKAGMVAHWENINSHLGLYHKVKEETDEAIVHIENALDANNSRRTPNLNNQIWYHSSLARLYSQKQQDDFFLDDVHHEEKILKHMEEATKHAETFLKQSAANQAKVQKLYDDMADVALLSGFKNYAGKYAQRSQDLLPQGEK